MSVVAKQTVEETPAMEDVYAANDVADIVNRNVKFFKDMIIAGVKALRADGRPLFTEKVNQNERFQRLLEAPPEFWSALESESPEVAASLAMEIVTARSRGKLSKYGPLAKEAIEPEVQAAIDAATALTAKQEQKQQMQRLLPSSVRFGLNLPALSDRSQGLE